MNSGNSNYRPIKLIGKGAFGTVILCRRIKNESSVCIKQIEIRNSHPSEMKLIRGEIYIISQLKHPRIIKFYEYYFYKNTINIVMEYASGGTLRQLIDKQCCKDLLNENEIRKLFCDILLGLEYLHIRGVVHRDLKPENVLIDKYGRPKIADFGISFIHIDVLTETIRALGTPLYIAPEILRGRTSDFRSDIWSLGCILYEICTFVNPFKQCRSMDQLNAILLYNKHEYVGANALQYCQSVKVICERMLTINPDKRISISGIIGDPWITLYYYKLYFDYR